MPKYSINGHTYESATELTDDEIDEIGGWDTSPEPESKSLWERANTPFTDKVSGLGKTVGKWIDPEQGTDIYNPRTALGAFVESVGNTVENMFFTPAGAAMTLALPGATALSRAAASPALRAAAPAAAKYLPTAAKTVHNAARVGSGVYGLEGGKTALEGMSEGDIAKILQGGLGAVLGGYGAKNRFTPYVPKPTPRQGVPTPFAGYGPQHAGPTINTPGPPATPFGNWAPPVQQPPLAPNVPTPFGNWGPPIPAPAPMPRNVPPPVESVPTPVTESIAETIRKINAKHAKSAEPPPVVEDPFTPIPEEPPPFDPRDPMVMPQGAPYEPPPSGTVGPAPTPALPPEITQPNMIPERPILDRTLTQNMDINPLSELAARRGQREGGIPRTHTEPAMGIEPEVPPVVEPPPVAEVPPAPVPEPIPEPVPAPIPEPIPQPTPTPIVPKKKGLQPRQKFVTNTYPAGPPKQAPFSQVPTEPTTTPPPVAQTPATASRLVKSKGQAPAQAPNLEHIVATNADQVTQYLGEGYKVVSRTADGNIVMERAAMEAPAPVKQKSFADEIAEGQARRRAEYEQAKKNNAARWGAARAKAKELGVDLGKERDIKAAEKMIQGKDPNWTLPEIAGGQQGPATAHARMPRKQPPFRPGGVQHGKRVEPPVKPETGLRKWYNEARGLMSVDFPGLTSAAWRQGLPFIGTKHWFSAFKEAAKAYGNDAAYKQVMHSIELDPLYQPQVNPLKGNRVELSIAEVLGLKFIKAGEIGGAEGVTRGPITSKLKYTAASDRSFAAFTNHLRAWTFKRLLKDAGIWDEGSKMITNEPLAREIADFVNTASGRGKLEIGYGRTKGQKYNLETSAQALTDAFFSPRLMFSRMKMMNPATYLQADPFVRKQYVNAMIRTIGSWWTIASLAEWAGGQVSKDPNNADFGKIRIGNTRIDPGGGFQQFLVLTHRLMPQSFAGWGGRYKPANTGIAAVDLAIGLLTAGGGTTTSSVTGNKSILGRGYKAETRGDIMERFVVSKLHPTAKLGWDALHASEKYPVYLGDRLLQMALPMFVPDVIEALQKDPEMAPLILGASTLGMGAQTYEGGRVEKPALMPKALQKFDIAIGAK